MGYGEAFEILKKRKVQGMRLPNWSNDVMIKLQVPDENSEMSHPYLYVQSRFGCVPWIETNPEKFSEDWEVIE